MGMDIDAIRQAVEHASLFALGVAFLTGIVFSFNPVALASIPVALAYVTKARTTRQSILFGSAFTFGMILVQALLGFIAGLSGDWVASLAGRQWGLLLGPGPYRARLHLGWVDSPPHPIIVIQGMAAKHNIRRLGPRCGFRGRGLSCLQSRACSADRRGCRFGFPIIWRRSPARICGRARDSNRTWRFGGRLVGESEGVLQIPKAHRNRGRPYADRVRPLHAERVLLLDTRIGDMSFKRWPAK